MEFKSGEVRIEVPVVDQATNDLISAQTEIAAELKTRNAADEMPKPNEFGVENLNGRRIRFIAAPLLSSRVTRQAEELFVDDTASEQDQ